MIAYKGFTEELVSILGNDNKETCTFTPGITLKETYSKTGNSGFHCCENPFECLGYYSLNGKNRFFKVEAAGDIDEDENQRIACTEITLLEELNVLGLALEGMKYMIDHPGREKWQQMRSGVRVAKDEAEAMEAGHIAIARGENPRVRGPIGSILGIIRENEEFGIIDAKLFVPESAEANKWLILGPGRKVVPQYEEAAY